MKKFLLFFLVTIVSVYLTKADVVNETTAAKAAKNHYFTYASASSYSSINLGLIYTKSQNGEPVYYIFNVGNDKGFIIISAEDHVYPVLGYAFEGSYSNDPGFDATNFNYWMDNYTNQIIYTRENSLPADEYISASWSNLLVPSSKPENFDDVNPLLTTLWDQGTYYNQLCPSDPSGPGGHVWAGCVATAMSQVMKYHNYPDQGTGSHSYYAAGYGTQTANFGATTYDWASMPNQIYSNNVAIATLLYHLGVSVDMQYSPSGSGAYSSDARDALVNYFGYSQNAMLLPKSSFPIETFIYKLKNELNLNRPVYYSGSGSAGGHAFVCDGYQGNDHFHFNWGWSGYANGYFYLNNLNPGGTQFNQGQSALFYTYPEGAPTLAGAENFTAEIIDNDVYLAWDAPSGKSLLGYNVYRNNVLIEFTSDTEYTDLDPAQGSYTYYVCALYEEGEAFPSESVSVFSGGGTTTVYQDNFEAYTSGGQLACQNSTDWTTWSNTPCSAEDAYISSDVTYAGSNAAIIEGTNDVVKVIENYTEGLYKISFQMNVPSGFLGYFNTLQLFNGASSEWGMQVFFDENGQGSIDGGAQGAATFSYPYDTWMYNEVIIDLNNDWAEYKLDGVSIHGWQWSIGSFGQGSLNQLGGVNFYAWTGAEKGTPKFYFDDFMIEEFGELQLLPPLNFALNVAFENLQLTWDAPGSMTPNSYNIYYSYNGGNYDLLENTTETSLIVESPGNGLHSYYLTAVYDEGESDPTNTQEVLLTGNDEIQSNYFNVFPNPAESFVMLSSQDPIHWLKLYNYSGQLLFEKKVDSKSFKLNIADLKAGIYFLRLETGNRAVSQQIVKY
ncbi:MAG: C10 family peptidase [Bacteroidales bacterium]|nr:C10 family peptidase [Bacteroidales bacterium]MCF8402417.1 C10 family peptidase [Bacteroidales bacterium]